jgi:hypothetical protein
VNVPAHPLGWRQLNDNPMRRQRKVSVTTALVAAFMLLTFCGSLFWSYRYHASTAARSNSVAEALPSSQALNAAATGSSGTEVTSNPPTDPAPFASFQQLAVAPHETPIKPRVDPLKPRVDPRSLRTIFDRGVATYASAKTDAERAKAASEIQTAASAGFPPARILLARNYPQSAPIRSVVPANDVVRYALTLLMDPSSENDDTRQIFLALAQHFAVFGQLDLLAAQTLDSMRGDSRPQLAHRIDALLDLLARVPGSCTALGRLIASPPDRSDQECSLSLSEQLRWHIEKSTSVEAK